MYFIDFMYRIEKMDNIFTIFNKRSSDVEHAFKAAYIDLKCFQSLLYYGFSEVDKNTIEGKLAFIILEKYPEIFHCFKTRKEIALFSLIRKYSDIYWSDFDDYSLDHYINLVREYFNGNYKYSIKLLIDDDLKSLVNNLNENPLIENSLMDSESNKVCDLVIANPKEAKGINYKIHNILFIHTTSEYIEIGPLVHCDKFHIPNFSSYDHNTQITLSESDIIAFFVERIAYIMLFDLYDKVGYIPFIPNRYKLMLNRKDLTIQAKEVFMEPRYLS